MRNISIPTVLILIASATATAQPTEPAQDVTIISSKDGSEQHALFFSPRNATARAPLLVYLHSWSTDYKTAGGWDEALDESRRRGWAVIAPNFRGVNDKPEACASDLAVRDVLDSVDFASKHASVDGKRIYLLGSSGGGFMGLVMASRAPKLWAAVSVWVPISNLATWHEFSKTAGNRYGTMMDQCFGGPPDTPERQREYRRRSPLFSLARAKGVRIHVDAGLHDGHGKNAVPLRQSLEAFNVLAKANETAGKMLSERDIDSLTKEERIPDRLVKETEDDPARKEKILFRRTAGPATVTVFDGGHSIDVHTGFRYFE